ncbi:MAG: hypothetical protein LBK46_02895, partial [Oscillospiraceae bacterium]|nr:hypothetical protein [Oscillospiraceae bacterium]
MENQVSYQASYQVSSENNESDVVVAELPDQPELTVLPAQPVKPAKRTKSAAAPTANAQLQAYIQKAEENQLALETRITIEHKTLDNRVDYRFNTMETLQHDLLEETRRTARDVRVFSLVSVLASIAVIIVITLIK